MTPLALLALTLLPAVDTAATPEVRALAYLAREVPRWSVRNKCYSCHNNGDAARALYAAVRHKLPVPVAALADTTRWLERPTGWDRNGGDAPYKDQRLAAVQFAAALVAAMDAGMVKDRKALAEAAARVARWQDRDGSWQVISDGGLGAPATHGAALATHLARRVLRRADDRKYAKALARADTWLRKVEVKTVLDAGGVLLALDRDSDATAMRQRSQCLTLVRKGQAKEGGWGPYTSSPPEVFDTAVVLLALARQPQTAEVKAMRRRGRAFLLAAQRKDGSWPETTRPEGAVSYAQRLSTTGWATLALLATPGR